MNAVNANGCTPLHSAAACGRKEAVCELIKLGASKSTVAGAYGTPLHQAAVQGHVIAADILLENDTCEPNMVTIDVASSKVQPGCSLVNICDSVGETPVMYAVQGGQVAMFKLLTSKGGSISDIDTHSVSTLEHCFVGGHASKLSQFCEACGIGSSGEGLRGALTTFISCGLVDPRKVLCLCAIPGDTVFLEDQFKKLVASDNCSLPAAVKCAKHYFHIGEGVPFIDQLHLLDENTLNPLQISLLSLKCFEMGFAEYSIQHGANDHTLFITKLLSHPVLKETVRENFPNGLSPLDLARQFDLPDIAALIEEAGGCPGVWADIPQDMFSSHHSHFFTICTSLSIVCDPSQGGHEAVKKAVIKLLGGQTVDSVLQVDDESQLVNEQILSQCPDLRDLVAHILPCIEGRHWKKVGLTLGLKKSTLDGLERQYSNNDDRYLETLSYWLEHGSSATWKTLLDVLGHFETKHTIDDLSDRIVSEVRGANKVRVQVLCGEQLVLEEAIKCCSPVTCASGCAAFSYFSQMVAVSVPLRPVIRSMPVVSGGAMAAERYPPHGEGELCELSFLQ